MLWWETQFGRSLTKENFILGLDKIEFLQSHEKLEIYERAYRIIEEYYGNDEEDARVAPSTQNHELQFTLQPSSESGFQF